MKRTVLLKFLCFYILLAGAFVFAALVPGRRLLTRAVVRMHTDALRRELFSIEEVSSDILTTETMSRERFRGFLCAIAENTSSDIRLIDPSGTVILSTLDSESGDPPTVIPGFDYADFPEAGTFCGLYSEPCLNVVIPETFELETHGYLSASRPMKDILADRSSFMYILFIFLVIAFIAALLMFFGFREIVYKPFAEIVRGMRSFADGNLEYRIPVRKTDDIGLLASSMNDMADRIRLHEEREKEFIANVSHDIRTPLTSIKGYTDALTDGTIPPGEQEKYLRIISKEVDRLNNLTREVLALRNIEEEGEDLHYVDFDIHALIRTTASLFEGACRRKGISVKLILTGEIMVVRADPDLVSQILYNLLDNAVKFSPENSEIRIETTESHNRCYVAVKDEGPGIPPNEIARIWDRFYKCDSSRSLDKTGSGLGLSIVREAVGALGQTVTVVSSEGAGSEFKFSLEKA